MGAGYGAGPGKIHMFYGVYLHGQLKRLIDEANARKGEVPAEQSGDVQEALKHLEQALGKVQKHAK